VNHKHSLHITIGGLGVTKKAGMILMALEVIRFTSPERITEALHLTNPERAMSWGRKGRAGLRERIDSDEFPLGLGKEIAVELRTLELPTAEDMSAILFAMTFFLAHCATAKNPKFKAHWKLICDELEAIGQQQGLDVTSNWGRSNENPGNWLALAEALPKFDVLHLIELINSIPKLADK
jgi:hypothetical protein